MAEQLPPERTIHRLVTLDLPEKKFLQPDWYPPAIMSLEPLYSQEQLRVMLQNQKDEEERQEKMLELGEIDESPDDKPSNVFPIPKPDDDEDDEDENEKPRKPGAHF